MLICMSFAMFLQVTLTVIGQAIASSGDMWCGLILNAIWAFTLIFCSYFLTKFGAIGLAASYLIAYGVHLVTSSIYTIFLMRGQKIKC